MTLYILYRGPLSSCNYDCTYCPFAKNKSSAEELERDKESLERFVGWIRDEGRRAPSRAPFEILFTPWGEALTRSWYREAMVALSHETNIAKVAIQTNLSVRLEWLEEARKEKIALWASFHPSETRYETFVERCTKAESMGLRLSVGMVGLKEHVHLAHELRRDLPPNTYLWINAYKPKGVFPAYYARDEIEAFTAIDPLFPINNQRHVSRHEACETGLSAITIDGEGDIRRCHFVDEVLGNIHRDDLSSLLKTRLCPNATCGCHIGYVHLGRLGLRKTFAGGILERIPTAHALRLARPLRAATPGVCHQNASNVPS